ncbi:MAG: Hsp20/alpha crystallin family protein [Polyangiaceae bacterium]|nr:Hsp20/alpha crystallin family protein [Polyangiaceae bacterium]
MLTTTWRDFDDAVRTMTLFDRHFGEWVGPVALERAHRVRGAWPAVNAFETAEAFVYEAEVPGLTEKDVSVHVEDDALVLRGERKSQTPEGSEARLRERTAFAFARKLPLPGKINREATAATLKDGLLTVTLPKAKDTLPRQITVKTVG